MSLEDAKAEIGYCCQTLCRKDVVADALPKITMEEALDKLYDKAVVILGSGYATPTFHIELSLAQNIIKEIYGR